MSSNNLRERAHRPMSPAEIVYRLNHREVRQRIRDRMNGIYAMEQDKARRAVRRDLAFWLGEVEWSLPASPAAQAALRVVTDPDLDFLAACERIRPLLIEPKDQRAYMIFRASPTAIRKGKKLPNLDK